MEFAEQRGWEIGGSTKTRLLVSRTTGLRDQLLLDARRGNFSHLLVLAYRTLGTFCHASLRSTRNTQVLVKLGQKPVDCFFFFDELDADGKVFPFRESGSAGV